MYSLTQWHRMLHGQPLAYKTGREISVKEKSKLLFTSQFIFSYIFFLLINPSPGHYTSLIAGIMSLRMDQLVLNKKPVPMKQNISFGATD